MDTLVSETCFFHSKGLQFSSFLYRFKFRSVSLKTPLFIQSPIRKWSLDSKSSILYPIYASNSMNYGGWDDLARVEDSNQAGKFDQLRNLLVSVGVDDRKHVVLFVIGFVTALAISRIRVSSVLVFPASVLVFAVGFLFGLVRGGDVSIQSIGKNGGTKGYKEENFRVYDEKFKELVKIFCELDVKMANFRKEIKESMESNHVQVVELESFHNIIKDINVDILQAKRLVDAANNSSGSDSKVETVGDQEEIHSNQKLNRKRRDIGASSFEFFQFIAGLFHGNSIGMRPNKVKNSAKQELVGASNSKMVNNQIHGSVLVDKLEEGKASNPMSNKVVGNKKVDSSQQVTSNDKALNQDGAELLGGGALKTEGFQGKAGMDFLKNDSNFRTSHGNYEFNHQNDALHGHLNKNKVLEPHKSLCHSLDLDVSMSGREFELESFTSKAKDSFEQQETFQTSNGASIPSYGSRKGEKSGSSRFDFKQQREKSEDPGNMHNQQSESKIQEDYASSSPTVSADVVFDKHLSEATDLVKLAREYLKGEVDEAKADVLLYKSARILSRAIAMKPMSLLAVGQLGNTFLLHGELKLRISRNLRILLSRTDSLSREKDRRIQVKGLDDQVMSKDAIASILVDVCEECEELLVAAGRKYRTALSIDGNDVRALYNWGLALYYRAQLIADIGPGAATDADKVYLAAIDKFDAMMSKSNVYAPDALFRWGVTLQQRSHLRPSNSKERMKLLYQAKRLFEDVLSMDSDNLQVREALLSCMSELNYTHF